MTSDTYSLSDTVIFRRADSGDLGAATRILRRAAETMMAEGKRQWDHTYPTETHVREDLERGVGYVLELGREVVGYCAVVFDGEPAYDVIEGAWLSEEPYVVAHRMAVRTDCKGMGLGRRFMQAIETLAKERGVGSFKVDTNYDNESMQGLLRSLGFTLCGQIHYQKGSRLAYEKLL